jgi:hypothetical protein
VDVLRECRCEETFIRILAWASFSSARRFAQRLAAAADGFGTESKATPLGETAAFR